MYYYFLLFLDVYIFDLSVIIIYYYFFKYIFSLVEIEDNSNFMSSTAKLKPQDTSLNTDKHAYNTNNQ